MIEFSKIKGTCYHDMSRFNESYLKEYFIENYPIIFIIDDMLKKHNLSRLLIVRYIITVNSDIVLINVKIAYSHDRFDLYLTIRDDGILAFTSCFQYSDPNFENHFIKLIKQYV